MGNSSSRPRYYTYDNAPINPEAVRRTKESEKESSSIYSPFMQRPSTKSSTRSASTTKPTQSQAPTSSTQINDSSEGKIISVVNAHTGHAISLNQLIHTPGENPLFDAIHHRNFDQVTKLLQEQYETVVKPEKGFLPIHFGVHEFSSDIFAMLIERCPIDSLDNNIRTALHHAALHANKDAVQMLLKANCRCDILDAFGYSAFHYAIMRSDTEIMRLIAEHNGEVVNQDTKGKGTVWNLQPQDNAEVQTCLHRLWMNFHSQDLRRNQEGQIRQETLVVPSAPPEPSESEIQVMNSCIVPSAPPESLESNDDQDVGLESDAALIDPSVPTPSAPTSSTDAESIAEVTTSKDLCVVCLDKEITHINLPCAHFCSCEECAPKLTHCPLCRVKIDISRKVFRP